MSDCPYTGKILIEKRELPLLPSTLEKVEVAGASRQAVFQAEELMECSRLRRERSIEVQCEEDSDLDTAMSLSLPRSLQTGNRQKKDGNNGMYDRLPFGPWFFCRVTWIGKNEDGNQAFAHKILLADLSKLQNSPPTGVSGSPRPGDILTWDCVICGLPDPLMEFGVFELTLTFPPDYPFSPPSVKFLTEMFHPNISPDGRVPLTNWSPAQDVTNILTDIQSLLSQPQLESAVNQEAAQLYRENRREYQRRVEQIIEESFSEKDSMDEPGGNQAEGHFVVSKKKISFSPQFISLNNKTDQRSQSGDGEVTSAGEGGESGGSPAPAEKDQQSSYLSMGARPKTRQDKK